jgi:predicted component of type VI protein secretion system
LTDGDEVSVGVYIFNVSIRYCKKIPSPWQEFHGPGSPRSYVKEL